jgi:N-acetylmuramoyl-L-alanine amidase
MRAYLLILISLLQIKGFSQIKETPFIKLVQPNKEYNITSTSQQFLIGSTCKSCSLFINDDTVKVYSTGAFAYEINLSDSTDSVYTIKSINTQRKSVNKVIQYSYKPIVKEQSVTTFSIERIQTFPAENLILKPGDAISFRVKALTGCSLYVFDNIRLYEMADAVTDGIKGIYQGKYIIQPTDTFNKIKIPVKLTKGDSSQVKETNNTFSVLMPGMSDVVITKGRLTHLEYGLGDDRLGGAKIGYLDSLIPLKVIGKVGSDYKIKLSNNRTAYISEEQVNLLPPGTFSPSSLTGKIFVYGDTLYDYVKLCLFNKLPYQSIQQTEPTKIVVDVFGATNNTNWIDQLETKKEIKKVEYEQISDDVFRIYITLKHQQNWGYKIYYEGNNLIIRVKQQPKNLSLKHLTIAVDAGHGGTNTGAGGPTGVAEKTLTLQVALKLQKLLEKEGAKVIMTRTEEQFFDNKERILFYRDSTPDLLISLHLNSSNDPIHVSGTSTFYKYEGFKPLSHAIYKRMLELGLKEYGNNGAFNFMLNGPIDYPNALVEMLFLSNPEEEAKILDEGFQQKIAEKITTGIKDFLENAK